MTIVGQFEHLDDHEKINKLKVQIKDLRKVNRSHQKLVGNLYKEIDLLKKDMILVKEEVQILNIELKLKDKEIGRMMKKMCKL